MSQSLQVSINDLARLPLQAPSLPTAEACDEQADVVILVDVSGSISAATLVGTRQFLTDLFSQPALESGGVQLGVLGFNQGVTTLVPLDHEAEDIAIGINRLQSTSGGTDISRALFAADAQLVQAGRSGVHDFIILITDGDVDNKDELLEAGNILKNNGVTLLVIGVDSGTNTRFLTQLASENYFFPIGDYNLLNSISDVLVTTTSCGIAVELVDGAVVPITQPNQTREPIITSLPIAATPMPQLPSASRENINLAWLLPLLLIPIVLFLLTRLLLRRNQPQVVITHHDEGHPTRPIDPREDIDIRGAVTSIPYPAASKPLTAFHEEVLIVGIGAVGGQVLDNLVERMDDTNTLTAANRPHLIHLRMSKIDGQTKSAVVREQGSIVDIDVTRPHEIRLDDIKGHRWDWARIANIGNGQGIGRYSARIALLNDFSAGPDGSVLRPFFQKYTNINRIYLVADGSEDVGANIMGDVAALLREATNNAVLEIHTLVSIDGDVGAWGNSILYELARLNTPGHVRIEFGPSMIYNSAGNALINSFKVFYGAGNNGAAALLWGVLVDSDFANKIRSVISPDNTHVERIASLSVVYANALTIPLRLLRDYLTAELSLRLLGDAHLPSNIGELENCTPAELNSTLQAIYKDGLRSTLRFLNETQKCHPNNRFIVALQTQFKEQYKKYQKQAHDLRAKIRAYKDPRLNLWLDNLNRLDEVSIHDYARWVARNKEQIQRGYPIELVIAGGEMVSEVNEANFSNYTNAIHRLVENIIYNQFLEDAANGFFKQLEQPMMKPQNELWINNYADWQHNFNELVTTGNYKQRRYDLYVPENKIWKSHVSALPINDAEQQDPTFALQTFITGRIPIKSLLVNVAGVFIHNEENITLDVFKGNMSELKETPAELQNALTYRDAMWRFYRYWRIGGREAVEELLNAEYQEDRELLHVFINKYQAELRFRQRVEGYLLNTPPKDGDPEEIFIADETLFGTVLRKVFLRFTNNLDDMKFYPPTDT